MNDRFPELDQLRIEVSDDTRALHMSAVEGEIRSLPGHSEGRRVWSRRVAAAAVMGLLLGTTITYLNFLPWEQLIVSGLTVVSAIVAGLI